MILVLGGNGQLGQEIVRAGAVQSVSIKTLSHGELDITDGDGVAAALADVKADLIVNAAAYTKVDLAEANVVEAQRANEIGPAVLARACANAQLPLVHVSTDYVFDGQKKGGYVESDAVRPINVYGRTKAAGEEGIRSALEHYVILRTSWLYSEFGRNFLKTILGLAATRDELQVVADQHGAPTSAREVAGAILRIAPQILRERRVSGTYHFTAQGVTTWHGFASRAVEVLASMTGRHPRVKPITSADYVTAAKRPPNSQLDCALFAETFGFSARHWAEEAEATTRTLVAKQRTAHVA